MAADTREAMSEKCSNRSLVYKLDELGATAELLRKYLSGCQVLTFTGSLGAGKTTLIRRLLQLCGVSDEPITSPTFTYLNVYRGSENRQFNHFDLYRIQSLDEFCALGFDEHLFQRGSWSFVEWPEAILPLLKHRTCYVEIEYRDDPSERRLGVVCSKDVGKSRESGA